MRFTTAMTRRQFIVFTALLLCLMGVFFWKVSKKDELPPDNGKYIEFEIGTTEVPESTTMSESTSIPEITSVPESTIEDPIISVSEESTQHYESEFCYYEIPQQYKDLRGSFPEVVQVYLWELCRQNDIDYYIVVALIEEESKYKSDSIGDGGNSKGYMQIYEKWHKNRMDELGVTDLFDPYQNISTGISFLTEIAQKYDDYNKILMVYNMGENGARKSWEQGIYSTEYSRAIVQRAQEIKQELQD